MLGHRTFTFKAVLSNETRTSVSSLQGWPNAESEKITVKTFTTSGHTFYKKFVDADWNNELLVLNKKDKNGAREAVSFNVVT
ncbi:hypothetical protein JANAI62_36910 [Jannaschia pagri]|uniref:Uncharacterized protein n=1 Tax=Jannaschia pagri TaxID=2829797 RepID=A0ABQ4NRS7_9RHOB|nr:hypothetical protein [Jannaschia sp. AI_61]GIT93266.1 hypothetical protein JANAI61_37240 [Jannaschia sp. AI_61]GIT97068.1 hypothetical protein JANAI62_36910 [Jannaschia sp. AI_62]